MKEDFINSLGIDILAISDADQLPGDIQPEEIILFRVQREAVERGHVESYLRQLEKFGKKDMRSRLLLSFDGYDFDQREIYQIPEIRSWLDRIVRNVPHFFYFLTPGNGNIGVAFMCIAKLFAYNGQFGIDSAAAKPLIEKISKSAVSFSRKRKDPAAVQFVVAETILRETGYDKI